MEKGQVILSLSSTEYCEVEGCVCVCADRVGERKLDNPEKCGGEGDHSGDPNEKKERKSRVRFWRATGQSQLLDI